MDEVEAAAKAHCDFFGGEGWWDTGLIADTKPKALDAMRAAIAALDAARGDPVARVVEWLRKDADRTEIEAARIVKNTSGNARQNAAEWATLVRLKRGLADAIERGEPFNG